MRILSIKQPAGQIADDLADINMLHPLPRIVLLAGANGSGKSRLLGRIRQGAQLQGVVVDQLQANIEPVVLNLKPVHINNPHEAGEATIHSLAENIIDYPGSDKIGPFPLHYIQKLHSAHFAATHSATKRTQEKSQEDIARYEDMNKILEPLLGMSMDRDDNDAPTLGGKTFNSINELSDGQKLLLQWSVRLHARGKKLDDAILIMDEPENHLHPDALIATIERIIQANQNGQLWIATHSVPLIASLYGKHGADVALYCMREGSVNFASTTPEDVIKSLMGGEKNIEYLRDFVDLPAVLACNRFAAECLFPPPVLQGNHPQDPQAQIVDRHITESVKIIKLLDFGCGKGRLLESLIIKHGADLPKYLDYTGWDLNDENKRPCTQNIGKVYSDVDKRWFFDRQQLAANHPQQSFDSIVMCNVLHEVPPNDWISLFGEHSVVQTYLHDTGELLIIEDYLMPVGEQAHSYGFLALDTEPLKALFCDKNGHIRVKNERDGRIKGHFIPKQLLGNISMETMQKAIGLVQTQAKEKIKSLRLSSKQSFKEGRACGFWSQQYTNASMWLADHPKDK